MLCLAGSGFRFRVLLGLASVLSTSHSLYYINIISCLFDFARDAIGNPLGLPGGPAPRARGLADARAPRRSSRPARRAPRALLGGGYHSIV